MTLLVAYTALVAYLFPVIVHTTKSMAERVVEHHFLPATAIAVSVVALSILIERLTRTARTVAHLNRIRKRFLAHCKKNALVEIQNPREHYVRKSDSTEHDARGTDLIQKMRDLMGKYPDSIDFDRENSRFVLR